MKQIPDRSAEWVLGTLREVAELVEKGKAAQAVEFMEPVVRELPEASLVHSYMAWCLSCAGRHREAIEHGRVAVRISPESEMSSIMLFRALWNAGEHGLAMDEMKRLTAIGPSAEYAQLMTELQGPQVDTKGLVQ
ncbi:MAG TPA: hypothetical protein VE291_00160 [Terracidiphilus sp.]|jgi:predicted Zn-dependent protease|nr:hypothetical protein [Terracidiphilus sp.]